MIQLLLSDFVHEKIHGAVKRTQEYDERSSWETLQKDHSSKRMAGQRRIGMRAVVVKREKKYNITCISSEDHDQREDCA